ncbi:hypothetical protein ADIARSV_0732 [Arcticibacter svalbardensis MN12-7]|uniref:Uncharacterized protein n=1 Tax=Arcticibacter svalbardensis MN12-7 TaxID=1150600 RepID=R9GWQ4_9SPHI|nr:hypothetical protein ADIARSV_0732 [Arcticibacter svalbardensis MN12-7]
MNCTFTIVSYSSKNNENNAIEEIDLRFTIIVPGLPACFISI